MPIYIYHCDKCEETFEVKHSMNTVQKECIMCNSEDCLRKVPFFEIRTEKGTKSKQNKAKPGFIVNKFIEDSKEELKKEKQSLRSELY